MNPLVPAPSAILARLEALSKTLAAAQEQVDGEIEALHEEPGRPLDALATLLDESAAKLDALLDDLEGTMAGAPAAVASALRKVQKWQRALVDRHQDVLEAHSSTDSDQRTGAAKDAANSLSQARSALAKLIGALR